MNSILKSDDVYLAIDLQKPRFVSALTLVQDRPAYPKRRLWRSLTLHVSANGRTWTKIKARMRQAESANGASETTLTLKQGSKRWEPIRFVKLPTLGRATFSDPVIRVSESEEAVHMASLLAETGCNLDRAQEEAPGTNVYRFSPSGSGLDTASPVDENMGLALDVDRFGRLGNNLIQVSNALAIMRAAGLKTLRCPNFPLEGLSFDETISGVRILSADKPLPHDAPVLHGNFFYSTILGELGNAADKDRRQIARDYILPLLGLNIDMERWERNRNRLTIHIRSGDIFSDNPHPGYPQPPLAFYKEAIRQFQETSELDCVEMVFQCRSNPCVDALEAWLQEEGIACRTQSGSLRDDLGTLINARNLVFGTGTFGVGVCLLAHEVSDLTIYGARADSTLGHYHHFDNIPRKRLITAEAGTYFVPGEWRRSDEQLDLMISYPQDKLIARTISG